MLFVKLILSGDAERRLVIALIRHRFQIPGIKGADYSRVQEEQGKNSRKGEKENLSERPPFGCAPKGRPRFRLRVWGAFEGRDTAGGFRHIFCASVRAADQG